MAPVGTVIPGRWGTTPTVPRVGRTGMAAVFSRGIIGAHLGMARTLALAEQGFYWPGMRADVSRICNECFPIPDQNPK